jgi:WD40 repeat protein
MDDTTQGELQAAAFTADGRTLFAGGLAGVLSVWDVEAGSAPVAVTHGAPILTICASAWHDLVVVGDARGAVTLRDTRRLEERGAWKADHSGILALAISPDGRWLATGVRDPGGTTLRVWRLGDGVGGPATEVFADDRHITGVYTLAFSPDSRLLAAGGWMNSGYSGTLLYDLASKERIASLTFEAARALRFSPDGAMLASGEEFGQLNLWDIGQTARRHGIKAHSDIASAIAFSPDGRHVISGSCDGSIKLWDVETGSLLKHHSYAGNPLDIHIAGRWVLIASAAWPGGEEALHLVRLSWL